MASNSPSRNGRTPTVFLLLVLVSLLLRVSAKSEEGEEREKGEKEMKEGEEVKEKEEVKEEKEEKKEEEKKEKEGKEEKEGKGDNKEEEKNEEKSNEKKPSKLVTVPSDGFSLVDFEGKPVGSGKLGLLLYKGGRVCYDDHGGWDKRADADPRTHNELNAVCKALGFKMGVFEGKGDDYDFKKAIDYSIYKTKCSSMDWSDCVVGLEKDKECNEFNDVFIICSNGEKDEPMIKEFTLVNKDGNSAAAGEMGLLKFKGSPVSEINLGGAQVACKWMGFKGVTHISWDEPQFKIEDTTPTILRTLSCESEDWFSCYLSLTNSLHTRKISLTCGSPDTNIECPAGTFLRTSSPLSSKSQGISACVICDEGFSAGGRTKVCTRCPKGFFTKKGAASEADCLVYSCKSGTYIDKKNNVCAPCEEGTYRGGTAYHFDEKLEKCHPCPKGKSVPKGEGVDESSCSWTGPCGAGKYLNRREGCLSCPAHTYSSSDNTLGSCKPCPSGSVLPRGAGTSETDCEWCPAGQTRTSSRGECTNCKEGTYSLGSDNKCNSCPLGTTVKAGQGRQEKDCMGCRAGQRLAENKCIDCPKNTYSAKNSVKCLSCPAGSIVAAGKGVSEESCIGCPAGQIRDSRGTCKKCPRAKYREKGGENKCKDCPAGMFVEEGKGTKQSDCEDCPAGQYRYRASSKDCRQCGRDSYRARGGGTSCKACPAGTMVEQGKGTNITACKPCPAGQHKYYGRCRMCNVGTYSLAGSTSCTSCPSGTTVAQGKGTNVKDCKPCPAGQYYYRYYKSCRECNAGTYSLAGSTSCTLCPSGTTVGKGNGTSITACKPCPAGQYKERYSSYCRKCREGTYSTEGSTKCTSCPSPTSVAEGEGTNVTSCKPCMAGTYYYSYYKSCRKCRTGKYSPKGSTECTWCPTGTTVAEGAGTEKSDCKGCAAGYYMNNYYRSCSPCSSKTTYSEGNATSCSYCPSNTFVREGLGKRKSDCVGCPAGQYFYYRWRTYSCRNCENGQYSEGGAKSCNHCPAGSTVAEGLGKKLSDCEYCPPGQYLDTRSKKCNKCYKGSYSAGKETSCKICPFGTSVAEGLGKTVDDCTKGKTFQLVDREGNSVGAGKEGLLLYRGGVVCTWYNKYRPNENAGMAICRWLGFDRVTSTTHGKKFGEFQTSKPNELDQVQCTSTDLSKCTRREKSASNSMKYHNCNNHYNDVFLTCAMGCPAGDFKNSNGKCEECHGTFSSLNSTSCSKCPPGKSVPAGTKGTSLSSCQWDPCKAGKYLNNTVGCLPCPAGTYSTGGKPDRCRACPSGKTVAAGEGTQDGDCLFVGEFKAFESLEEDVGGIRKQIKTLEQYVAKLATSDSEEEK